MLNKMNNKYFILLITILLSYTNCFSMSLQRNNSKEKIILTGQEIVVKDKCYNLFDNSENELVKVFGKPDSITDTFGGYDYFFYNYDIKAVLLYEHIVESISLLLYDNGKENNTYVTKTIKTIALDNIVITTETTFDEMCTILKNNNIEFSQRENQSRYTIWLKNYCGKDICINFYKRNNNKISEILVACAFVLYK